jgi:hypothetical protein
MYEKILEKSLKGCSDELERELIKFCKYEKQVERVRKHAACTGERNSNIYTFRRCLTEKITQEKGENHFATNICSVNINLFVFKEKKR